MDLRSLKIFLEVAELGSFTKAGERLGYSQPTVSFQIKQLERELGVKLFDRIGHTVNLTDAGRDALEYAQRICLNVQEMTMAADTRREPAGIIRLGMADSLCGPLIAEEFASFRQAYPRISLQVITGGTADLFHLLDHNAVDLVCTLDSHVYNAAYVIAAEEKVDVRFVVAAEHPLADREKVDIRELIGEPFLLTEKGVSYGRLLDERLAMHSLQIQPVLELSRTDQICALVERNVGVGFLPDYVTENSLRAGRIARLEVPDFDIDVWKQLLYRRDKWVSRPMAAMIRHLSAIILKG